MAITTPASTAEFGKAIDPAVQKYFNDEYKVHAPMIEKIYKVGTQDVYNHEEQNQFGFGDVPQVVEGGTYTKDVPLQGYTTTYTPKKFGRLIPVTDEMRRYDQSAITKVTKLAQMGTKALTRKVSRDAAVPFNGGFSTAEYSSYGDAKPLFSTIHPRADAGTAQSNASATGLTLTEANLETAEIAFIQQLDDRGQPIECYPVRLLVPSNLSKEALIITGSDKRSGTGDNDRNVYALNEYMGGKLDVTTWRYLDSDLGGSATAWFLLGNDHKLTWLWGVRPEVQAMNETEGYSEDTFNWKIRTEYSYGHSDWRELWGSLGDGQAYAS